MRSFIIIFRILGQVMILYKKQRIYGKKNFIIHIFIVVASITKHKLPENS